MSYIVRDQRTMSNSYLMFLTYVILSLSFSPASDSEFWLLNQYVRQNNRKFEQKTDKFWEFHEESNSWVEVKLPYDLVSCVNHTCETVGSIQEQKESSNKFLALRKRISLTKMSDASIWITGPSGAIYERFWNGLQWVIAPHDLPVLAISTFIINHAIFALSETGNLYQMQLNENSQPVWVGQSTNKDIEQLVFGVKSEDNERIYFSTKSGSLLELSGIDPPRWRNHGKPPGANVAAIVYVTYFRPEIIFTVSGAGDLYEYDPDSKPAWKKHIKKEGSAENISLAPSKGCSFKAPKGPTSISLFLLTKGGKLVERQFQQRKWKWKVHGSPKHHFLTSITCASQEEQQNENTNTIFLTTAAGLVFEFRISKLLGPSQENQVQDKWTNHVHPTNAKVCRGITGLQLQVGRMIFPLDDGRLAELHLPGIGGEYSGPNHQSFNFRRKSSAKYIWSILDAPETEGWNAEYCTEKRGPINCISGMKDDEPFETEVTSSVLSRRKKGNNAIETYLPGSAFSKITNSIEDYYNVSDDTITNISRLRTMQSGKSFFLVTDNGLTYEYLNAEHVWFWLRHDHSTAMKGVVGNYNGSLFLIDEKGSLFVRERNSSNKLTWINCTAMRKGREVIGGPPWDGFHGKTSKVTADDALFFVSKTGRLLQLTVALRKYKWKDCKNPQNTKIASILDQEFLRKNIVFVVGFDGQLYQYNKVTELWHKHLQSQHLVLSRLSGTAMRSSSASLKGSLFMISESGGLVEYHWNSLYGWNWIEHGTPNTNVASVGSPGPFFGFSQLILIGSDGQVYLRYIDKGTWKWNNFGFPLTQKGDTHAHRAPTSRSDMNNFGFPNIGEICFDKDFEASLLKNCNLKVEPIRPILFGVNSVIFQLKDGRLAEMRQNGEANWEWSRIIGTPTSSCLANYWTALAS